MAARGVAPPARPDILALSTRTRTTVCARDEWSCLCVVVGEGTRGARGKVRGKGGAAWSREWHCLWFYARGGGASGKGVQRVARAIEHHEVRGTTKYVASLTAWHPYDITMAVWHQ